MSHREATAQTLIMKYSSVYTSAYRDEYLTSSSPFALSCHSLSRVSSYKIRNVGTEEKGSFFFLKSKSLKSKRSPLNLSLSIPSIVEETPSVFDSLRGFGGAVTWRGTRLSIERRRRRARYTVSVIRRGLRSPLLPTRHLGGWTPPRRFGIPTRDVAPPTRGIPT